MLTNFLRSFRIQNLVMGLAMALTLTVTAHGDDKNGGLQTINNAGGGQVVYGPLTNVTSLRDAMAAMLKHVHFYFGDKPTIGKFFQAKGSDSTATFFQITAKKQGGKPMAGMVIISLAPGAKNGAAAVLWDDATRFSKTQPVLMKKLNEAWHQENARLVTEAHTSDSHKAAEHPADWVEGKPDPYFVVRGTNARGNGPGGVFGTDEPATSSRRLHLAKNGDDSGSIGLPDGWQVTGGSGGSLQAAGPQGETIAMGILNQNIYDPRQQQMISYMSKGSIPFSVCSYSRDLVADYECVSAQARRRMNKAPLTLHVLSTKTTPQQPNEAAILAEIDFHEGNGLMLSSIKVSAVPSAGGAGGWRLYVSQVNLPKDIADGEWSTIAAMIMTYRQNSAVIEQETIAVINQINRTAEANRGIADARSKANDAHNAQVEATWDDQAKRNKAFENYTLDYAVLHDPSDNGSYGRFTYPTADVLVKAAPDRFQYTATQDLLKGIDY